MNKSDTIINRHIIVAFLEGKIIEFKGPCTPFWRVSKNLDGVSAPHLEWRARAAYPTLEQIVRREWKINETVAKTIAKAVEKAVLSGEYSKEEQ